MLQRGWSAMEVCHLLLNFPLQESTRTLVSVNCRHPAEQLVTELTQETTIQRTQSVYGKYLVRSHAWEELSYLEFLTRIGHNLTPWRHFPWAEPRILNYFPWYRSDPLSEDYESYCRVRLLLHHPHRLVEELKTIDGIQFASFRAAFEYCQRTHLDAHPDNYYTRSSHLSQKSWMKVILKPQMRSGLILPVSFQLTATRLRTLKPLALAMLILSMTGSHMVVRTLTCMCSSTITGSSSRRTLREIRMRVSPLICLKVLTLSNTLHTTCSFLITNRPLPVRTRHLFVSTWTAMVALASRSLFKPSLPCSIVFHLPTSQLLPELHRLVSRPMPSVAARCIYSSCCQCRDRLLTCHLSAPTS